MIVVGHIQSDFFLVFESCFLFFNQFFYEVRINCGKIFKDIFASCNVDASQFRCWSYSQYWPELHY
jgi:hypothetical protein